MQFIRILLLAGCFVGSACLHARAQLHAPQVRPVRDRVAAHDQFAAGHYRLAAESARRYLNQRIDPVIYPGLPGEDARYILAVSSLRLGVKAADSAALAFLRRTADPAYSQRTHLALARWYFGQERFAESIPHYREAGIANLSNTEIAASKFELAYALFNNRRFEEAAPLFLSIREVDGPYRSAGNYYHGLLAYNSGDYAEALKSFERIAREPAYREVVPYYIAELYYYSGDRQKALAEAQRLMRRTDKLYYDTELRLLAAQVLFEEGRYADALPYFERYYTQTGKLRKEELYEMAYSHYRVSEWKAAIEKFKPLSAADDSLGQTAMYLLGDCYLQTGDKRGALGAFRLCADAPHVAALREAAGLLAAKLAYEAGYNGEASTRLSGLLRDFPATSYRDEIKTLQSEILLRGGQYGEALASLTDIGSTGRDYRRIRQRVTYGLGVQKLAGHDEGEATRLLNESVTLSEDNAYSAAARFWLAEAAYRQEDYTRTLAEGVQFMNHPGRAQAAALGATITPAAMAMTLGHAAFEKGDYAASSRYFAEARKAGPGAVRNTAALLREADALQMERRFAEAAALYDQAAAGAGPEAEYARLQKAVLLGLRGESGEKAKLLQGLVDRGSASPYAAEARYELALLRLSEDRPRDAITLLIPLTQRPGPLVPKALLRLGVAYGETGADSSAVATYRRIVVEYPASEERSAALDAIRGASVERGRPQDYADLLRQTGLTDYSATLDSTYYASAERAFEQSAWKDAAARFTAYLGSYPSGFFAAKAHYYLGRSYENTGARASALRSYDSAGRFPLHPFSEPSASRGALLAEALADTTAAENFYHRLRDAASSPEGLQTAYLGLSRRAAGRSDWETALRYSDTLATVPDLREPVVSEAALLRGRALMAGADYTAALAEFSKSEKATAGSIAAESRYRRAEALLRLNKLTEAEAAADAAIRRGGDDRWVLRSYLLIAEILQQGGDFFNAKATLQSLIKNARDAGIKAEATAQLARVVAAEKQTTKLKDEGGPTKQ